MKRNKAKAISIMITGFIRGEKGAAMFRVKHFCSFLIALLLLSVFIGINYHSTNLFVAGENQNLATNNTGNSGNYTNVILLGWDGVQRNHLFELINRGLMPNLVTFCSNWETCQRNSF